MQLAVSGRDTAMLQRVARAVRSALKSKCGIQCTMAGRHKSNLATIVIEQSTASDRVQSYRLQVLPGLLRLTGADEASLRLAFVTLGQLLAAGHQRIAAMTIDDWPDFPVRGVMLDVSRDKVPRMNELLRLIDQLADWKINQFQLYMEHTFAYRGHKAVWKDASPFTPAEIRRLDAHCRNRGIELVPNQNSFGHMERWLCHAKYAPLAETDRPWRTPWGTIRDKPTTLSPSDRGSIRLVAELYDQLLPNFASTLFNAGCDETWELGQGRSRRVCARRGKGRVYLDYLLKVYREVRRRKHRMMFWADIIMQYPSLIRRLPKDAVVLIWGYESDHPFASECRKVAATGLEFYVCPGTSSWCSFAGRTTNSKANLRAAARYGRANGAKGFLITDWGDFGHRQYMPASYVPFACGAGAAWCAKANYKADVNRPISRFIFMSPDEGLSQAWSDAGDIYRATGVSLKNRTVLFSIMEQPLNEISNIKSVSVTGLHRALSQIRKIETRLQCVKCPSPESKLAARELSLTLRVMAHACTRGISALQNRSKSIPQRDKVKLASDMGAILAEHRVLWLKRNRPGGLESSLGFYRRVLNEYLIQEAAARSSLSKRRRS